MRIKAALCVLDDFLCGWRPRRGGVQPRAGLFHVEFWMFDVEFVLTSGADGVE